MKRFAVLVLGAMLLVPSVTAAQDPSTDPVASFRGYLQRMIGATEALQGILETDGPDEAAALAGPVADQYELLQLETQPDLCYQDLYINNWHLATFVRLLAEVPQEQRQGMVDMIADRLAAGSALLDGTDCGTSGGPIATTSPPTVFATPAPTPEPVATPRPTKKPSYKQLTKRQWQQLVRSPDDHVDERIKVWACITQFDAATGDEAFLGQAFNKRTEFWFSDGDNALFVGDSDQLSKFVEDDIVSMDVTAGGSFSYDTQAGGNTTVPMFTVDSIRRRGSCE